MSNCPCVARRQTSTFLIFFSKKATAYCHWKDIFQTTKFRAKAKTKAAQRRAGNASDPAHDHHNA
jgi:hypothetical protein